MTVTDANDNAALARQWLRAADEQTHRDDTRDCLASAQAFATLAVADRLADVAGVLAHLAIVHQERQ